MRPALVAATLIMVTVCAGSDTGPKTGQGSTYPAANGKREFRFALPENAYVGLLLPL